MAKGLSIEFNGFAEYAEKIDQLGGNLQQVFDKALKQAGETIQADTRAAVADSNLPAGGKYSTGDTKASIINNVTVLWSGSVAEMPVGFDKSKPGSGGFLITGTPRMKPDMSLNKIYKGSSYSNKVKKEIEQIFQQEVNNLMG